MFLLIIVKLITNFTKYQTLISTPNKRIIIYILDFMKENWKIERRSYQPKNSKVRINGKEKKMIKFNKCDNDFSHIPFT